jgi:hypothetical protein
VRRRGAVERPGERASARGTDRAVREPMGVAAAAYGRSKRRRAAQELLAPFGPVASGSARIE